MSWNVQVATWTSNNRYPGIFRTVQSRVAQKFGPDLGAAKLKILSFGCSNGSEITTLRSYFPEALIYGCDVNASALHSAAELLFMDEAILFQSSPENIAKHGPFDVVFAMSVLCRFPESMNPKVTDLNQIYEHKMFESAVGVLVNSLKTSGILCLYNTNYSFNQLRFSRDFRIIRSPLVASSGFVDRFDASGQRLSRCEQVGPYYVHRLHPSAELSAGLDFTSCIFEKDSRESADIHIPHAEVGRTTQNTEPEFFRFGPDLDHCARDGLIATSLGYWFKEGAEGHQVVRAWYRTTPDRKIEQGISWASPCDDNARALLSANARAHLPLAPRRSPSNRALGVLSSVKNRIRSRLSP